MNMQVLMVILQLIMTIIVAIVGWLLKRTIQEMDRKINENKEGIKDNEQAIRELREDFNKHKTNLPFCYVLRDDFIRAISSVEQKLDKIFDKINEYRKKE